MQAQGLGSSLGRAEPVCGQEVVMGDWSGPPRSEPVAASRAGRHIWGFDESNLFIVLKHLIKK